MSGPPIGLTLGQGLRCSSRLSLGVGLANRDAELTAARDLLHVLALERLHGKRHHARVRVAETQLAAVVRAPGPHLAVLSNAGREACPDGDVTHLLLEALNKLRTEDLAEHSKPPDVHGSSD